MNQLSKITTLFVADHFADTSEAATKVGELGGI